MKSMILYDYNYKMYLGFNSRNVVEDKEGFERDLRPKRKQGPF